MSAPQDPLRADQMKLTLTFPAGLVESSTSFVVLYRNQFGVVCMAYQEPGADIVGWLAPETQELWGSIDPNWPDGQASGTFDPGPVQ